MAAGSYHADVAEHMFMMRSNQFPFTHLLAVEATKSETWLTASILKQDPNTHSSRHSRHSTNWNWVSIIFSFIIF